MATSREKEPGGGRQSERSSGSEKGPSEHHSSREGPAVEPTERSTEQRVRDVLKDIGKESALNEQQMSDLVTRLEKIQNETNQKPDVRASRMIETALRALGREQAAKDIALLRDAYIDMLIEGVVARTLGLDTSTLDKYHHGLAHCLSRIDGATSVTELAGYARELATLTEKAFKNELSPKDIRDSLEDIKANNVDLDDRMRGKPRSPERCRELVESYSPGWRTGSTIPDHLSAPTPKRLP